MARKDKFAAREKAAKKRVRYAGLPVTVDRPRGHVVEGTDSKTGAPYRVEYQYDYGYFPRTRGGDAEGLDVFLGPNPDSARAFWVTHLKDDRSFDELKVFVGFDDPHEAAAAYEAHYPARWYGGMREGTVDQIRALLGVDPKPAGVALGLRHSILRVSETAPWFSLRGTSDQLDDLQLAAAVVSGTVLLDLGVGDVNQASAIGGYRRASRWTDEELRDAFSKAFAARTPAPEATQMSALTTKKRAGLSAAQFADPANRGYPIQDKAHADNAAARLEQQRKNLSPSKYAAIKRRIDAAQARFGETKGRTKKRVSVRAHLGEGGELHVRHLHLSAYAGDLLTLRCPVAILDHAALAGSEGAPVWIQLAKSGVFRGHESGKTFQLNAGVFDQIVQNYDRVMGGSVAFDFEHASEQNPASGDIATEGAPAQGWIKGLRNEGHRLMALVEWLPLARRYILGKNYRFVSPSIRFGVKHQESGENVGAVLTSAALTNVPFLAGMQPIAAKSAPEGAFDTLDEEVEADDEDDSPETVSMALAHAPHEYMGGLREAMGLSTLSTAAEMREHLGRLRGAHDADQAGDQDGYHEGIRLQDHVVPLRTFLDAPLGMTVEDLFDRVQDLVDAAMEEHVEEFHGGDDDPRTMALATPEPDPQTPGAGPPDAPNPRDKEPDTMDLAKQNETLSLSLAEANEKLAGQTVTLKSVETAKTDAEKALASEKEQTNKLTLSLTAETAETAKWRARAEAAEQKVSEERSKQLGGKVGYALKAYAVGAPNSKGLTEDHRPALMKLAETDEASFDQLYPPGEPGKEHLLLNLTQGADAKNKDEPTKTLGDQKPEQIATEDFAQQVSLRLNISYEDAVERVGRLGMRAIIGEVKAG